jgi:hypothetical protein
MNSASCSSLNVGWLNSAIPNCSTLGVSTLEMRSSRYASRVTPELEFGEGGKDNTSLAGVSLGVGSPRAEGKWGEGNGFQGMTN